MSRANDLRARARALPADDSRRMRALSLIREADELLRRAEQVPHLLAAAEAALNEPGEAEYLPATGFAVFGAKDRVKL